jgi:hypothetical protein
MMRASAGVSFNLHPVLKAFKDAIGCRPSGIFARAKLRKRLTLLSICALFVSGCETFPSGQGLDQSARNALHPSMGQPELTAPASWYFLQRKYSATSTSGQTFLHPEPDDGVLIILKDRLVLSRWLGGDRFRRILPTDGFPFSEIHSVQRGTRGLINIRYLRIEYGPLRPSPGGPPARDVIEIIVHGQEEQVFRILEERRKR